MSSPVENPDFVLEAAIDVDDQIVIVKPPVDGAFRTRMYDILDGMGLMKGIVVTGDNFFGTRHLPDGKTYSELRISRTALDKAGQRVMTIAQRAEEILREQHPDKTVDLNPYLVPLKGSREIFEGNR